jgi:hypothetical protein
LNIFFFLTVNWNEGMQIWHWLLIVIIIFVWILFHFVHVLYFCLYKFVYFLCQELWLFYVHFFSLSFFLVNYLILLMFCFIMHWPTDNSDILRLYTPHPIILVPRFPWQCHFEFYQHAKSFHTLRWIFLRCFMKFDERNDIFFFKSPLF